MSAWPETWTDAEQATLGRMAAELRPVREIANALGKTRNAVIGRAARKGVKLRDRPAAKPKAPRQPHAERPRTRIAPELRAKARELYLAGLTYAEISAQTGISTGNFAGLFRDLPKRRQGMKTGKRYDHAFKVSAVAATMTGESFRKASARLGPEEKSIHAWKANPAVFVDAEALAARVKAAWGAEQERLRIEAEAAAEAERVRIETNNEPIFALMSERTQRMLRSRVAGQTLQQVGDAFGVTRERVRQIEVRWRAQGLIVPGAEPLSEAAIERFGPKNGKPGRPRRTPAAFPYELAHSILDGAKPARRPYRISDEERARRAERMRRVGASGARGGKRYGSAPGMAPA